MRWRQVVGLWAVALALSVPALLERREPPPAPAAKEHPPRRRVMALAEDRVRTVELTRQGTQVVLRQAAGGWTVERPPGARVSDGLIRAFVEAIVNAEEIERLPLGPQPAQRFGLGERALHVVVETADGQTVRLAVGDRSPTGTAVYARLADAPVAVLIGRNLEYYATLILDAVRRAAEPDAGRPVA